MSFIYLFIFCRRGGGGGARRVLCGDIQVIQHCLITSGNVYAALKNSVIIHKPIDQSNSSIKHHVQWF